MEADHLAVMRMAIDAFNEGDSQAARDFLHDDIVFEEPPEQPAPRVAKGIDATTEMLSLFDEAWERHHTEVTELRVLDDDRVLLLSIEYFRGRDGIEVDQPCGTIFTFLGNKIVRMQPFWEQSSALEAASAGRA